MIGLYALVAAALAAPGGAPAAAGEPPEGGLPASARVEAARVEVAGERLRAEGDVRVVLVGQRCEAESLDLDARTEQVTLHQGSCTDADGRVHFQTATFDLRGATGVLVDARLEGGPGPLLVTANRIERLEPSRLRAEGAWLSLCRCERAPWSVEARQVEVVLDEVARIRGGWIQVCGARVVPIPAASLALADRRTGLLVPRLGWGRDGLVAAQPVMVTLGRSADLVVMPEWRQQRGLRGVGEARLGLAGDQGLTVSGFGGFDALQQAPRGAVRVDEAWAGPSLRSAIDGQWLSDGEVLVDYGDDFLSRSAPWSERRAVAGAGIFRVETDRFQPLQGGALGQRLIGVAVAQRAVRVGPVLGGTTVRYDRIGVGADPLRPAAVTDRIRGAGGIVSGARLGPGRVSAQAGAEATQWAGEPARLLGRVGGDALLDLWGDVGPLRHVAAVGVAAGARTPASPTPARLPDERTGPRWRLGPVVHSQWLGSSAVPVSARLSAPWTPSGWRPRAALGARLGAWQGAGQGTLGLQELRLVRDDGVLRVGAGAARTDDLLQGNAEVSWRLPGPLSELRPRWAGLVDALEGRLLSQGVSLGYTSRCDCLRASAGAVWSADRDVPDLLLQVDLQ